MTDLHEWLTLQIFFRNSAISAAFYDDKNKQKSLSPTNTKIVDCTIKSLNLFIFLACRSDYKSVNAINFKLLCD